MTKTNITLITNEKFKSWLAGLIDGEGNFYISKKGKTPQIRIILTERDKYVLELIKTTVGGNLNYRKPTKGWKSNWKPQWCWGIYKKNDCINFTKWIIDDLVLKKSDAIKFLCKLESQFNGKDQYNDQMERVISKSNSMGGKNGSRS